MDCEVFILFTTVSIPDVLDNQAENALSFVLIVTALIFDKKTATQLDVTPKSWTLN